MRWWVLGEPGQRGWEPLGAAALALQVPGQALGCSKMLHAKAVAFVSTWLPALVDPWEKRPSLGGDGSEVGLPQEEEAIC